MIPRFDDSGTPPARRRFSTEVEARLVDALIESGEQISSDAAAKLDRALRDAAREAQDNQIQVEDLMIAFKHVEQQAISRARKEGEVKPDRVRILKKLLEAYYS